MILEVQGVGKRYRHADGPVDALANIDLRVPSGRFVTITGCSGAGKSTLLLILGGLLRASTGTIRFRDTSLHTMSDTRLARFRRKHLGFVMQNFSLVPYLTALQNVAVPLALQGRDGRARRHQAGEALDSVGLGARANHLPRELSIGQQQRVAIARAFVNEPDLILADEPTGNLDPSLSDDILGLLETLNRDRGTTVIMVTHSPDAASRGDLRVHLEDGRIVERRDLARGEPVRAG